MSHEIRTPMNAIMGFSALLAENDKYNENKHYYINLIRQNGRELLRLVNDVINLAKIESGQLDVEYDSFNLKSLLEEIYSKNAERIKKDQKNKTTAFRFNYEHEHVINSDRERIKQILNNLLSNAFKFTEKGHVELGVYQKDEEIVIYVKDTGIGLDKNEKRFIFDRFRKVVNTRDKIYGGTGLGLSISKGMAEMLGGEITLESDKASGSVFYLSLPYTESDYEKQQQAESKAVKESETAYQPENTDVQRDWSDKVILLVEDTYVNYLFMRAALLSTGVNLVLKETGEEALEYFENNRNIDLVLLDIRLPGMNGYDVARKMHAQSKEIPIISQTAYTMKGDREKSLAAGCVDYIAKPMTPDELIEVVGKYL